MIDLGKRRGGDFRVDQVIGKAAGLEGRLNEVEEFITGQLSKHDTVLHELTCRCFKQETHAKAVHELVVGHSEAIKTLEDTPLPAPVTQIIREKVDLTQVHDDIQNFNEELVMAWHCVRDLQNQLKEVRIKAYEVRRPEMPESWAFAVRGLYFFVSVLTFCLVVSTCG